MPGNSPTKKNVQREDSNSLGSNGGNQTTSKGAVPTLLAHDSFIILEELDPKDPGTNQKFHSYELLNVSKFTIPKNRPRTSYLLTAGIIRTRFRFFEVPNSWRFFGHIIDGLRIT